MTPNAVLWALMGISFGLGFVVACAVVSLWITLKKH